MGTSGFPAGLRLDAHKEAALARPLADGPIPRLVVLALDQGAGDEATPCVEPGARVHVGGAIALDASSGRPALHSPVSGSVQAVELRSSGSAAARGTCVVIDNDGRGEPSPDLRPLEDFAAAPAVDLLDRLAGSGIVGLGGAAFPTAVKLAAALAGGATHLVLNGAECEPWICCDDALMRSRAPQVVLGARVLMRASGADRCTIAIEDDKPDAVAAMRAAIAAQPDERLSVQVVPAVYPTGAERQLLAAVTGVEVPSGRLPSDVGLLCQNVGTAAAVAEFVRTGMPCIRRVVTVTGSGVARPGNLDACIGTPLADLVAACGGYTGRPERLIVGGTLTGRALPDDEAGLAKSMNCVVAATAADLAPRSGERPCIRCGDCARVCPAGLLPQQLHRGYLAGSVLHLERHGIDDCIECGCCDYVCPSQIPLTERFRRARSERREQAAAAQRAADARRRHERHRDRLEAAALAERRAFEEARRRARDPGGD